MSPEVREVWDYTLNELKHMRLATGADRDTLVAYCEAVVAHRQASQLLAKSSVLVPGLNGMVRNPAFHVQRDAANTIRVFAAEFGLTPSARSRIRMEERAKTGGGEGNPFAAVANG